MLINKIRDREIGLVPDEAFLSLRKHITTKQHELWFFDSSREHYSLLAWISNQLNNETIYDIGTFRGLSALAMSVNPTNKVVTYDIEKFDMGTFPDNIEFKIGDFFTDSDILKTPFIMFDVDPHDGKIEELFIKSLIDNNYKGVVMFDDIHLNDAMQSVWDSITLEKHDLTEFGHWSGTGVVIFS
jgi:hypothetical protein